MSGAIPQRSLYAFVDRTGAILRFVFIFKRPEFKWDSSVGIATRYWLDGPGSNPGGSEIFRTRPDRPTQPPVQWVPGLSRG